MSTSRASHSLWRGLFRIGATLPHCRRPIHTSSLLCNNSNTTTTPPPRPVLKRVFSFGYGEYGQLGLGSQRNVSVPTALADFDHHNIRSLSAGWSHAVIVTGDNQVASWGSMHDNNGAMLQTTHSKMTTFLTPTLSDELSDAKAWTVKQIECGRQHTVVLTENGHVFVCGNTELGQAGNGESGDGKVQNRLIRVMGSLGDSRVVSIHVGFDHNFAVTDDGRLHGWGFNMEGQLGLGHMDDVSVPTAVPAFEGLPVVDVICGGDSCAALVEDGSMYTWGVGEAGQLGHGDKETQLLPIPVEAFGDKRVVAAASGGLHTLAILEDSSVWSWGWGVNGRLGHGSVEDDVVLLPKRIGGLEGVEADQVACGGGHSMVVDKKGQLYSFGLGMGGRLGLGHEENTPLPTAVALPESFRTRRVVCGVDFSVVIAERDVIDT